MPTLIRRAYQCPTARVPRIAVLTWRIAVQPDLQTLRAAMQPFTSEAEGWSPYAQGPASSDGTSYCMLLRKMYGAAGERRAGSYCAATQSGRRYSTASRVLLAYAVSGTEIAYATYGPSTACRPSPVLPGDLALRSSAVLFVLTLSGVLPGFFVLISCFAVPGACRAVLSGTGEDGEEEVPMDCAIWK
eukprot:2180938-Rhodomonas_salina.1